MGKKMTQAEWVARATEKWDGRWDYSKVEYVNATTKVIITCPSHGDFLQTPVAHDSMYIACKPCSAEDRSSSRTIYTTEKIISRSKEVWGEGKYDYSSTKKVRSKEKVSFICPDHGEFKQLLDEHFAKKEGCPDCSGRGRGVTTFLSKAAAVWGDRWDYSNVVYTNNNTPIEIICSEHGSFTQPPKTHLRGAIGCPECSGGRVKYNQARFLKIARDKWGDRWDYSKVVYVNSLTPIIVGCPLHGDFSQRPDTHLRRQVGCRKCNGKGLDTEEFLTRVKDTWGERWDVSGSTYHTTKDKVLMKCVEHGDFYQLPESIVAGHVGCPKCKPYQVSSYEKDLHQQIIDLGFEDVQLSVRGLLPNSRQEIDLYIPSLRIGIEINGVYYHSEQFRNRSFHYDKYLSSKGVGIRLLQIWEDDWLHCNDIVMEHIKQVLGVSDREKVYARNTSVVLPDPGFAAELLGEHHIQGHPTGSFFVGLEDSSGLVAVAAFQKNGVDYILTRYATSKNVLGGHSKIISHFEKNFEYRNLITFADLSWSNGDLYRNTGWVEDDILPPDYQYVVRGKREHKFNYRKKRFKEDPSLKYEEGLTETQLAALNGLYRIYDCGKIRFVKPRPDDTTETLPESRTDG